MRFRYCICGLLYAHVRLLTLYLPLPTLVSLHLDIQCPKIIQILLHSPFGCLYLAHLKNPDYQLPRAGHRLSSAITRRRWFNSSSWGVFSERLRHLDSSLRLD